MATKYLNLSTDSTFSENSDYLIPSQKAIKTAVDSKQNKITTGDGLALSEDGQLTNTILDKTVLASNYVNPTLWKGTLAEYEALGTYDDNITYIITDDTDLEDMINDSLISKSSTYSSSKINELLSNDSTNIQGGEYISVIKPKGETLYEYDVFDLVSMQYGISTCNNIVLNTNVFDYVGVSMLDFIRIDTSHSNDLYGFKLPESFIPYLIPATKKDGTQYTVEEILTQEYINALNGTFETPFETFAEMLDYASYSNAESTALVYIVKFEQEGASFLTAVYPDKNGNYIHLAGGMYDITPINTIETESSDKPLTIDWNEKALSMFENLDALPSQEGNSGKFLTTDGSVASWSEIPEQVSKLSELENDVGFITSVDESNLVHKSGNEEITGLKTVSLTTTPVALLDNNELYNEEHYVATSEIKVNDKVIKTQYSNTFEPEMLPGVKIPMNLEKIHNEFSMDTMLAKGDISHFESTSEVPMSFTKLSLEYVDTTSDTKIYDINTEIQIAAGEYKVDVTDIASNIKSGIQLNPVTKHLVLTGEATTFDANTHQDAVPTIKYVKDLLSEITTNQLNNIYPVNSLYFCTQSTCPMSTLIAGSTWEKISSK